MPAKTLGKKNTKTKEQAVGAVEHVAITSPTQNENRLPEGWKWVKLGEICEKVESVKRKNQNPKSEFLYLDIGGIDNSRNLILEHKVYNWKDAPSRAQQIIKKSDILFSTVRTYMKNIAIINRDIYDGQIASSGFCVIRAKQEVVDSKFVFYLTLSNGFLQPLNELQTGSSYPAVRDKDVFSQLIPLPPLPDQHAILSKIEKLLSELDKGKQQLETAQQQLKVYRQAVLKWAFEGKLSELGLVGLKDEKIIEREKKEILKSSNQENPNSDNLPKGWKVYAIKDVAEINPKLPNRDKISDKMSVQFLPMKLVEEIVNKIHLTEIREYKDVLKGSYTPFINGDVIFAKVTPCMENGKIALVENLLNGIGFGSSEFHVVRSGSRIIGKYLFYYLVQDRFRNEAANEMTGAVGLRRVPKQFIENHNIPLPPLEQQHLIVQEIESRLSVCDKVEETITQSLAQAETLRQSILKKAFEGKLV